MKVLFLDIDGVMNCAAYFNTRLTPRDARPRDIDPYRVVLLHRLIEATGVKVVVSSSWRLHGEALEEVKKAVEPHYLDKTPRHERHEDRHAEIREWLSEHPEVEKYAILDDDLCAGEGHGENFFKTEWYGDGLNEEIVEKIIQHFK